MFDLNIQTSRYFLFLKHFRLSFRYLFLVGLEDLGISLGFKGSALDRVFTLIRF